MGKSVSAPQSTLNEQEAFLALHGWGDAARAALPGDFSARHYVRLQDKNRKALLMIMPKAQELAPFLAMQAALNAGNIRVPTIYAVDADVGFAIIEDLGDQDFNTLLRGHAQPEQLYAIAVEALQELHHAPVQSHAPLPHFTPQLFLQQAGYFLECYGAKVLKKPFTDDAIQAFNDAWSPALDQACSIEKSLMLRDFHAANIMYLEHETSHKKAAVIDFQDGGIGPITYDLASLLEDARLDVSLDIRARMIEKYLAGLPIADHAAFMTSYHILACQRHMRILGILVKRWVDLQLPVTQDYFVRVWRLLYSHRAEPALAPVYAWLDAHIPASCRDDWTP